MIHSLLVIFFSVITLVIWFFTVMYIAKYTVGKNAKTWQIFFFLIISGPFGWTVLALAAAGHLIESVMCDK